MTANGLTSADICTRGGTIRIPASSSWSISNRERPRSCVAKSASESKRSISSHRLLQSSCSSHLQYISIRGRSCTEVAHTARWEGRHAGSKRRHTSCPARTRTERNFNHPLAMDRTQSSNEKNTNKAGTDKLCRRVTNPTWSL